jgi:hypothetical protein
VAWPRDLGAPIVLKDGRRIATIGEARALIAALPIQHQMRAHWRHANDLLHDAGRRKGGPNEATLAQLRMALKAEGLL